MYISVRLLCVALQDEAGVIRDMYDSHRHGIASAKSQLSVVSTVLVGWAVIITVAVVVLLVVAFTRLRRGRLLDVPDGPPSSLAGGGVDVASWSCDAEVGLPASAATDSKVLESDMEPDDLPVDMSRLCGGGAGHEAISGTVISEDELNTRDIPRFVYKTVTPTST